MSVPNSYPIDDVFCKFGTMGDVSCCKDGENRLLPDRVELRNSILESRKACAT